MGAISAKGRSNMSCRTNATRSAGASVFEYHEQRETDRIGQ
jgi:hypothetical protein